MKPHQHNFFVQAGNTPEGDTTAIALCSCGKDDEGWLNALMYQKWGQLVYDEQYGWCVAMTAEGLERARKYLAEMN